MSIRCNSNLPRSISVADFILEDNGHSIAEAIKEFKLSRSTIERDINYLGSCAFYGNFPNERELQQKYIAVKKTLARLDKENKKYCKYNNSRRATSK